MKKRLICVIAAVFCLTLCVCSLKPAQVVPSATAASVSYQHDPVEPLDDPSMYGNASGNLIGGKMAKGEWSDELYVALEDGIYALDGNGKWRKVCDDRAESLNAAGYNAKEERLVYIAIEGDEENGTESIVTIKPDGSDRRVLLDGARVGKEAKINWENTDKIELTNRVGFTDLSLRGG